MATLTSLYSLDLSKEKSSITTAVGTFLDIPISRNIKDEEQVNVDIETIADMLRISRISIEQETVLFFPSIKVEERFSELEKEAYDELSRRTDILLSKRSHFLSVAQLEAEKIIEATNLKIAKIVYSKSAVELTPSGTIKYKLEIDKGAILTIIKPLNEPEELGTEGVIFDLFVDGVCVRSDFATLSSLIEAANAYSNT